MTDPNLSALHRLLRLAIERSRPHGAERPVTVAEIYQDLVPYRSIRDAADFPMNADYELALMRLLAGEGGRVRLEPEEAREELTAELATPNPNVTLYRKFAACDVWVAPADSAQAGSPASASATAHHVPDAIEPPTADARGAEPALELPDRAPSPPPAASALASSGSAEECRFCRAPLPAGRAVRYCPQCGQDQSRRPCGECGEVLESGWRFCIACGHEASRA